MSTRTLANHSFLSHEHPYVLPSKYMIGVINTSFVTPAICIYEKLTVEYTHFVMAFASEPVYLHSYLTSIQHTHSKLSTRYWIVVQARANVPVILVVHALDKLYFLIDQ